MAEVEPRVAADLVEAYRALPGTDLTDIGAARAAMAAGYANATAALAPDPSIARGDHKIAGDDGAHTRVRIYTPSGAGGPLPAVVFLHGGGFVLGTLEQNDFYCEALARDLGCVICSVDYALSPEATFPAALDDAYRAITWLHEQARVLGVDAGKIAAMGRSSGGGLAAGLALMLRDRGEQLIHYQSLIHPMLDHRTAAGVDELTDKRIWNSANTAMAWQAYLGDWTPEGQRAVYASPALAADMSGLPPTFISTGDLDLFFDEDVTFAMALCAAGVATELHVYPGAFHGYDAIAPGAATALNARREMLRALRWALFDDKESSRDRTG